MAKTKTLTIHNPARLRRELISDIRKVLIAGIKFLRVNSYALSFIMATDSQIASLNKSYLSHTGPTDVISFAFNEDGLGLCGEAYIGSRQVYRNSKAYKTSFKWEICFTAVHGLLHIAGYTDATPQERENMWLLQEQILKKSKVIF